MYTITPSTPSTRTNSIKIGAPRRCDASLAGRLNRDWEQLITDPASSDAVATWAAHDPLRTFESLADIERAVAAANRADADAILLALLILGHAGDELAARTVLQLMLGKAIRIAASHAGRAPREHLEHLAITALYTVIATYPVERRPVKVAANIAMDTLHAVVAELSHDRMETPTSPEVLSAHESTGTTEAPADLELLNLLAWAVDHRVVTPADASLIVDIYTPGPNQDGGKGAAERHGLTWAAARQRASRAVRRITQAIQADTALAAPHRQAAYPPHT